MSLKRTSEAPVLHSAKNSDMNAVASLQKKVKYKSVLPSYRKVYSVYAYSTDKYREIWGRLKALAEKFNNRNIYYRVSPYRVLEHCYIRDKNGFKKHIGDCKHIFRYKSLENIFEEIALTLIVDYDIVPQTISYLYNRTRLMLFWHEETPQAELIEVYACEIKERLSIHITLLKCLRSGFEVEDAIEYVKLVHKSIFEKYKEGKHA